MASPITMGPNGGGWIGAPAHPPPPTRQNEYDEFGLQVRPMGVKVHYTFDRDSQINCLARCPQIQQVQTIPIDERNWIGVVDLRLCLHAVVLGSPEIVNQADYDYTVYAFDYSEPDTPLVGQGLLTWALEPAGPADEPKMVTGRVTKNLLAVFGNGIRETLEVKLKLTAVPRSQHAECATSHDPQQQQIKGVPTPTETTEWNHFIQANPIIGRQDSGSAIPSPGLIQPQQQMQPLGGYPVMDTRPNSRPASRQSQAPLQPLPQRQPVPLPPAAGAMCNEGAPSNTPHAASEPATKPSRPSSRASRSRGPTGRPRGRPRKKAADGNTSAAEEQPTDADEGPQKKRAKIIKADYPSRNPFDAAPESLRVAASTSGSLRTMRPLGVSNGGGANHLAEIPRAPTPVPQAGLPHQRNRVGSTNTMRRQSTASNFESSQYQGFSQESRAQVSQQQDARSPTDSVSLSMYNYTPADSPAELGSSPPVPRSTVYMQSSPAPSSPILPPMRRPQQDSGFMSGDVDDLFDEEDCSQTLPPHMVPELVQEELPARQPHRPSRPSKGPGSRPVSRKNSFKATKQVGSPLEGGLSFQVENPGPPELLPATSIYNPPNRRALENAARMQNTMPPLVRSNTEPSRRPSQQPEVLAPLPLPPLSQSVPPEPPIEQPLVEEAHMDMDIDTLALIDLPPQDELPEADIFAEMNRLIKNEEGTRPEDNLATIASATQTPAPEIPAPTLPAPAAPSAIAGAGAERSLARSVSVGDLPQIPASDPVLALALPLPAPPAPQSEAVCPPSDALDGRSNKNMVKKLTIKQRLEDAIASGEMPPFCQNCGAVETPTWRKMWTQDHDGVPGYYDYSEKPGHVTAIDILERDEDGKPKKYRLVMKTLANGEDKKKWTEMLLCNPCGIWLSKFRSHRPQERWEKDRARLRGEQPKRKRDSKSRSKKSRTKSDGQAHPTSEAYFTTDPIGPGDQDLSPQNDEDGPGDCGEMNPSASREGSQDFRAGSNLGPALRSSPNRRGPGSTHSRGSGTADSPIPIEDDLGLTRRLLFPSPRKDGVLKVLGNVNLNVAKSASRSPTNKPAKSADKENVELRTPAALTAAEDDDMADLFGTPPRPSTPPPRSSGSMPSGPFKTPTRATPSHRVITRSISKTIRSVRSLPRSPSQALLNLQKTPTRTPRSSSRRRLTPNRLPSGSAMGLGLGIDMMLDDCGIGEHATMSPFTAHLNKLLSEAHDFTAGSPSHGLHHLELGTLPNLESDGLPLDLLTGDGGTHSHQGHGALGSSALDFATYLNSTDCIMPSSPPVVGKHGQHVSFATTIAAYEASAEEGDDLWGDITGAALEEVA